MFIQIITIAITVPADNNDISKPINPPFCNINL